MAISFDIYYTSIHISYQEKDLLLWQDRQLECQVTTEKDFENNNEIGLEPIINHKKLVLYNK